MHTIHYQLSKDQHLGDITIDLDDQDYITHISADTGVGKSSWVMNKLGKQHNVVFAVPQLAQITQLEAKHADRKDVSFYYAGHLDDALTEIASMRLFAGLSSNGTIPDHTTIMNFRHLLERYGLARRIFEEVSTWLSEAGVLLKEGTLKDATIIEAPSSTKNTSGKRDLEMHQTKKGNQWQFGLKAHIGLDARTGLTHSFTTTAANEHDLNQAGNLLHGEEGFIFADSGYRGAEKREELKGVKADWHIAEVPSKVKALKKHPRINKALLSIEYMKASIRAKVEHQFRIIKCQFGFTKTRYRGLKKNDSKLAMLFTLANIARVDQMMRA